MPTCSCTKTHCLGHLETKHYKNLERLAQHGNSMNMQATWIAGGRMATTRHTGVVSEQEWLALRENLGLSRQQAEIIRHILRGASDKEIAEGMEISVSTVRTYLHRLFRKFNLNDRLKLALHVVACARRQQEGGLYEDDPASDST